jgi:hypothetical protein
MFEAAWLPIRAASSAQLSNSIAYPLLQPDDVAEVCRSLRAAARSAQRIPVHDRVAAIEVAIQHITDPNGTDTPNAADLLSETAGFSAPMVRAILERIRANWNRAALERLLQAELSDPAQLDGFALDQKSGRRTMARGPELLAHIFSGNVPGVAVESLIRALLVKSASFGKLAAEEPVLPVLFARALPAELSATIAVNYWPGGSATLEDALFAEADAIVVYGGGEAIDSIRNRTRRPIISHGPRVSFGIVGPAVQPDDATAMAIARAVALFDQQGCVSPHLVYVIGDYDRAASFGHAIARALTIVESDLPRGRLTAGEAVAINAARARAEFGAIAGRPVELLTGESNSGFTVVIDADDKFELSCLNRFVYVKPLRGIARLDELLQPVREYLQSVAIAGFTEKRSAELAHNLGALGASRITTFNELPWPPLDWHHDGSRPLGELLRWIDLELG